MPTDRPRKRDACDDHDMRQGVNLGTESDNSLEASWKALGTLYHNFFSGLILSLSSREGQDVAGEWSFNLFRRQHHEKFRSSLDKLGLTGLSDAVAVEGMTQLEVVACSSRENLYHACRCSLCAPMPSDAS